MTSLDGLSDLFITHFVPEFPIFADLFFDLCFNFLSSA